MLRRLTPLMLVAGMMLQLTALASASSAQGRNRLRGVQYLRSETAPDAELEKAILQALPDYKPSNVDEQVRYYYNRVDLNGDGKPEVIAHLVGSYVCGTGGCDTLIFQPAGDGYRLVSNISLTRNPIIVSPHRTKGWNDLVVYVAGGGITRGYYVTLRFNGRTYPDNPTVLPKLKPGAKINGKAYIADEDVSPGTGVTLKPGQR